MSEERRAWEITTKIDGSWGNANGPMTHKIVIEADITEFHPGHIGFYNADGYMLKLMRNEDVYDLREVAFEQRDDEEGGDVP